MLDFTSCYINSPHGACTGVNNACCVVYYTVHVGANFKSVDLCLTFQLKTKVTEENVKLYMKAPCFCFADLC